ncbi:MAG: agmatinase [archaeon GB-1867-035]|nr:agmatinase [Candidatus Culexmicrobium profundum]
MLFFGISKSDNPNLYVLGIAWDGSSTFRRGSSEAPRVIREATTDKLYNSFTEDLIDLREVWRYRDLGDVTGVTFNNIVDDVSRVVSNYYRGEIFLFLGGDHSVTYASVKALKSASNSDFALIYFDAHPDLYPQYDGDRYSHACTVRRLVEEDFVRGDNVVEIGIRAPTREQIDFAREAGITIVTTSEVHRNPHVKLSFSKAYISIDLDVLDPAFAPGVGNPEPGGLSVRELIDVIKSLNLEVVGFDIVEFIPKYDCKGITAFTASKIIREILGFMARTKTR